MADWNNTWSKDNEKGLARYVVAQNWGVEGTDLANIVRDKHDLFNKGKHLEVVETIYNALSSIGAKYDPALESELGDPNQNIIRPEKLVSGAKAGACLDFSLLFCGLCLKYDLLPTLVMLKGHTFVVISMNYHTNGFGGKGVNASSRKTELESFERGILLKDENELVKLIESGAYLAIECTGFTEVTTLSSDYPEGKEREKGKLSFERAIKAGMEQLTARAFLYALEIYNLHLIDDFSPFEKGNIPVTEKLNKGIKTKHYDVKKEKEISESSFFELALTMLRDEQQSEISLMDCLAIALEEKENLLVLNGPEKSGKTTCCQSICNHFLEEDDLPIPIYISCDYLNDPKYRNDYPIHTFINDYYLDEIGGNPKSELHKKFLKRENSDRAKYLLLLDGYFNLDSRNEIRHIIKKRWIEEYDNVLVMITTTKDLRSESFGVTKSFRLIEQQINFKINQKEEEAQKKPLIFILTGTSKKINEIHSKRILKRIPPGRYNNTLEEWRPYSKIEPPISIQNLIEKFKTDYEYPFDMVFTEGDEISEKKFLNFLDNLYRTIGIIDLLALDKNNEDVARKFDDQRSGEVGGIILPFDDDLKSSVKELIRMRKNEVFKALETSKRYLDYKRNDSDHKYLYHFYASDVLKDNFISELRAKIMILEKSLGTYNNGNRIDGFPSSARGKF